MSELALVVIAAALVNNLVLVQSLGVGTLFDASSSVGTAMRTAIVTGIVLTTAVVLANVLERYVLAPLDLTYLRLIAFVALVAVTVAAAGALARRNSPRWLDAQGPLVTANSALLGVTLLNSTAGRGLAAAFFYGVGAALGFGVVLVVFAGLRERLAHADVPLPFRGAAIVFVTAGILSLAFLGFAGFARL
jgi:electron transport complex protein RnfA